MAYEEWSSVEKVKKYSQKRYSSIDQRLIDRREKKIVNRIFLDYRINGKILDIPCGYGRFHELLSKYGEVHAADNGKLIAKYQKENIGIVKSTSVCEASDMPFKDNSFDAVFSFRLMQHIHTTRERISIYKEFARVTKKWVLISVYINTPLHRAIKKINNKKARITFLNEKTVFGEFKEAGLKAIKSKFVLPALHGHKIYLTKI